MKLDEIKKTLSRYGFVEINELQIYIMGITDIHVSLYDAEFIRDRVTYCLERHGIEGEYFEPLRRLLSQLEDIFTPLHNKIIKYY
ncbi:hypothetical protein ACSN7N_003987 [Enterobacter hormaechei]